MAALALSQRTARYTGLDPEAVWNAGITAVASAFVISRLLLIAFNLQSFLQYPLLMMSLPSLTSTGVLLTSLFMLFYLHWRRLPLLTVLDTVAPIAALLWAFVSLGRVAEGTKDGMPTHLPWGVGDRVLGAVHPVEIYAARRRRRTLRLSVPIPYAEWHSHRQDRGLQPHPRWPRIVLSRLLPSAFRSS